MEKKFNINSVNFYLGSIGIYYKPLSYYIEMYEEFLRIANSTFDENKEDRKEVGRYLWALRVNAVNALCAKGSEAISYALQLLHSKDSDAREDGGAILSKIGGNEKVVKEIIEQLEKEKDQQSADSLVIALGQLKNKLAIPVLGKIIKEPTTDNDTLNLAVESLGKIVKKKFNKTADPKSEVLQWLEKHI